MTDTGSNKMKKETEAELLCRELPKELLQWYPFAKGSNVLYIGDSEDPISEMLGDMQGISLQISDLSGAERLNDKFDYVICISIPEKTEDPGKCLSILKSRINDKGKLLLGMNNRLGLRYFCGDRDRYTGRNIDGLEDYGHSYLKEMDSFEGRMYDHDQLYTMLNNAGFGKQHYYSVFPDLNHASLLLSEDYYPNEDISTRFPSLYNYPSTVFLFQSTLYQTFINNKVFHTFANAYLIECMDSSSDAVFTDALQVTNSFDRGPENAMITIVHSDNSVSKEAVYHEGSKRLKSMMDNLRYLKSRGIDTIDITLENSRCVMPYYDAETGLKYLKRLMKTDKDRFLKELDLFVETVLRSSDIHKGEYSEEGIDPFETDLMSVAMLDMVPLNSFYIDGKFVFFDQEFSSENYPAGMVLSRVISSLYTGSPELTRVIAPQELYERYDLWEDRPVFLKLRKRFSNDLKKEDILKDYYKNKRCDNKVVFSNRQRMNYSADEYQKLFVDIFDKADTRKLILFGSGLFAKKFLALYGTEYPIYAVIDNDESKWGEKLFPAGDDTCPDQEITIQSPDILRQLNPGEYKVLICIKNYTSVMHQLDKMGVKEYSLYDAGKAYPRKRRPVEENRTEQRSEKKKYHTGYIAGVFDLFHVGHLNMFKRAKEQCDYLIVGVVSDKGVSDFKKTKTFVPLEERIEMIKACRYVDEVVEIPYAFGSTAMAWRMYHFDVQFSGSDYIDDPKWEENKKFLEENGATLQFFDYTQSTSSTKLKALIDKKLI